MQREKRILSSTISWRFVLRWPMPVLILLLAVSFLAQKGSPEVSRFPADKASGVNPDTHLVLTFRGTPELGKSGQIRIYDMADHRLVDSLDMSIPAGPAMGAARGAAPAPAAAMTPVPYDYASTRRATNANTKPGTPATSQLTIIGGFSDGFHFYPAIVRNNSVTFYLHNNLLQYNKTYAVEIDPDVLTVSGGSFSGIAGNSWTFTTKAAAPPPGSARLVVSDDGSGDFNTVQGALDFIPDRNPGAVTIFIKNGMYEEIVYFRNKSNVTLLGEDRDKVVVSYANNEVFNPHPANVSTNEVPGTFPSRRATFMADNSSGIQLVNFSIRNPSNGQAEGLLMMGSKNIVSHMNIAGSGDALQLNGSTYLNECLIEGAGDTILGRGPAFFDHCELHSRGAFMWIRNTDANHGNVFVHSKFLTIGNATTEIARAPTNNGKNYPYAEAVLIDCILGGISPVGWGAMGGDTSQMHYWEYNSTNAGDGTPVDIRQRKPESRQLTLPNDASIIANYRNPAYVLEGWSPAMPPLILTQPAAVVAAPGRPAMLSVKVAAVPEASYQSYQWLKNGVAIAGATNAEIQFSSLRTADAGNYTVTVSNASGRVTSNAAALTVR